MVETRSQGKERNEEEEKIMEEVEREKPAVKEIYNLSGDVQGESELGEMTDEVYADTSCGKGNCMDKAEELPCKMKGKEREEIMKLMEEDRNLNNWRKMADRKEGHLVWEKGLLMKKKTDDVGREIRLIVIPKSYRERLLALARSSWIKKDRTDTDQTVHLARLWHRCSKVLQIMPGLPESKQDRKQKSTNGGQASSDSAF